MKEFLAKVQPGKIDMHGVSATRLQAAVEKAQLNNFPFISASLGVLFLLYALIQGFVLRESRTAVMVIVAILSALIIFGQRQMVLANRVRPARINRLYGITTSLVLLSMMLRLFFTGNPRQSANLAFFLVGIGVLLFSMRWFWGLTAVTLIGWLISALLFPPGEDWVFYGVVILAAAATGSVAQIVLTRTYRQSEILRIENAKLYQQTRHFNRQLEERVQERTQKLREANARLERLDKTKTDFITIASHELRTPLTILNVHNQILLQDEEIQQNSDRLKRVQQINAGAARMEEVVETMLDVAKIDSQSLNLHLTPLNLSPLILMVSQQFRTALAERNLSLHIESLKELPEVEADSESLQKVFHHLIMNAIKYTPDGGKITISGRKRSPQEVEIVVADNGIGIAPDAQPLIFEKFYQTGEVMLHSSGKTTFKGGGSGLGLAIAKGIVAAHNGRIWVESPDHDEETCPGSAFHVALPIAGDQD
ncbi:MAG: hypothetical protein GY803_10015 [Chloroflexi bacterium]|nr:hypothetical protein [Chloroflexota bacterium]